MFLALSDCLMSVSGTIYNGLELLPKLRTSLGLPLYSPTAEFTALMSLYEACGGEPSPDHPEIVAFRQRKKEEEENRRFKGFRQNMDAPWIMWQPPVGGSTKEKETTKTPGQSILRF